ncbi:hypothetical protein PENANT_c005G02736 [Penicillium antarcticum]|uniref:Uncharacterized protein n=1 Tax=Penicillium antarcticum TaxID=416450 RepID=A0A1V6QF18_9EURO|nr:hypothetical protein PENANT_c005G02736 [Penicillium antarcticum]
MAKIDEIDSVRISRFRVIRFPRAYVELSFFSPHSLGSVIRFRDPFQIGIRLYGELVSVLPPPQLLSTPTVAAFSVSLRQFLAFLENPSMCQIVVLSHSLSIVPRYIRDSTRRSADSSPDSTASVAAARL